MPNISKQLGEISDEVFLKMYSCNKLVKGTSNAAIVDMQRQQIFTIPINFAFLLDSMENQSINLFRAEFKDYDQIVINEFIDFLIKHDLAFYTNQPHNFPSISDEWDTPSHISNCIIDYSENLIPYYKLLFKQLDDLLCECIYIRVENEINLFTLFTVLDNLSQSTITNIYLLLNYSENYSFKSMHELLSKNRRIREVQIFDYKGEASGFDKITTTSHLLNSKSCGKINSSYFTPNIEHLTEAKKFNTCLNRKISITKEGLIKNCPFMKRTYGNIMKESVTQIAKTKIFRELWGLNKDKINVCKDCEFRYVCTDCRAYVEDPEDIYSKPLKCGYNPYTGEWSEWSTNPLKHKAIAYYNMKEETNPLSNFL